MRIGPTRRLTVATLLGALALAVGYAGSPVLAAPRYPAAVRHVFVDTCAKTAVSVSNHRISHKTAVLYCTRALTCISNKLTLKQFEQVIQRMQSGAHNPKASVLTKCEKSAGAMTFSG
jgi:hypothetical protein